MKLTSLFVDTYVKVPYRTEVFMDPNWSEFILYDQTLLHHPGYSIKNITDGTGGVLEMKMWYFVQAWPRRKKLSVNWTIKDGIPNINMAVNDPLQPYATYIEQSIRDAVNLDPSITKAVANSEYAYVLSDGVRLGVDLNLFE